MKKAIISLAAVSILLSGGVMASGANNDSSYATLNFEGRVTSNLCQVSTADTTTDIELGEVTVAQIKEATYKPQSFVVTLNNCDTTTESISYTIADKNGSAGATAAYLEPESNDTSAQGVGVYIEKSDGTPVTIGREESLAVQKDVSGALPQQSIALRAYIKDKGDADSVVGGSVNASATMTIKTAVAASAS
ncbi:type 1 fimbrial protein [Escherichia coli]|nr:type 1 fimbrial protein [Escherichia coli]HBC6373728.1 type 1 fimbrial protein [Escherichia coli]HCX4623466.1 type 1 fimbrial protein [Escherichia coli]